MNDIKNKLEDTKKVGTYIVLSSMIWSMLDTKNIMNLSSKSKIAKVMAEAILDKFEMYEKPLRIMEVTNDEKN